MRVLIIDEDRATADTLCLVFRSEGDLPYDTDLGEEGIDLAKLYEYDLIVLDRKLPDMPGETVLAKIRNARVTTPIMFTASGLDVDARVRLLNAGADAVLSKPFHRDEVLALGRALARRGQGRASNVVTCGPVAVDLDARCATVNGERVHLTGKEYQLLELMMVRKGVTQTKEGLLNAMYGGMDEPELKIIDVFVCKLRAKLSKAAGGVNHIETVWGRGYRMVEEAVSKSAALATHASHKFPDKLVTTRGRIMSTLAEAGKPLMAATLELKLDMPAGSIYATLNNARRTGHIELRSAERGRRSFELTEQGRQWLIGHGWKPEAQAA